MGTAISNDDPAPIIAPKLEKEKWYIPKFFPAKSKPPKQIRKKPPTVGGVGTCPRCGTPNVVLTKDHIIPKWAYKRIPQITKGWMKQLRKELKPESNIQWMCGPCNSAKSGTIEVSNPLAYAFWKKVRDVIDEALKKHEEELSKDT